MDINISKKRYEARKADEERLDNLAESIYGEDVSEQEDYDQLIEDLRTIMPKITEEYLVTDARLSCDQADMKPIDIMGVEFNTSQKWPKINYLHVEKSGNVGGKANATVSDCIKEVNIRHFGNCKAVLNGMEKTILLSDMKAQKEGICSRLMEFCGTWESPPALGGNDYFSYGGEQGIMMMSRLLCRKGGWITPVTSGQDYSSAQGNRQAVGITKEDLLFAREFGLKGKQLDALWMMRQYMQDYPELNTMTSLFAFEGLGNYDTSIGGTNTFHPNGQFGALMLVTKDGQLIYATANASTLPDKPSTKTAKDGVYNTTYKIHQSTAYAAIQARMLGDISNATLPACQMKDGVATYTTASGINVHAAGKIGTNSSWSEGCITVWEEEYQEFGVSTGYIKPPADGTVYTKYSQIKANLKNLTGTEHTQFGYLVIDRSYMDEQELDRFYPPDPKEGK